MNYYKYFQNPHGQLKATVHTPAKTSDSSFKTSVNSTRRPDVFRQILEPKAIKLGPSSLKPKMNEKKKKTTNNKKDI